MKKIKFATELAYLLGLFLTACSAALMALSGFGVSMVVAPCYLIYLKVSQFLPFFTFGMSEYSFQAVLLILMCLILRKFKISYLFSFVTAVLYGVMLDFVNLFIKKLPVDSTGLRALYWLLGLLLVSFGIALMFHTYISQEVYELFVAEISRTYHLTVHKFKLVYDLISLGVGLVLMVVLFGLWPFTGIGIGTFICAVVLGPVIGKWNMIFEKVFDFTDGLPLRRYFIPEKGTEE